MFSLKPDYPMVAPSYAEARRELALKIGLGRPRTPTKKEAPAPTKEGHQDPAHESQGCLSPLSEPDFFGGILGPLSDGS